MNEEKRVILNIMNSEIETLKFLFADCINDFYSKFDNRVSIRREKIVKYISMVSNLLYEIKEVAEDIKND